MFIKFIKFIKLNFIKHKYCYNFGIENHIKTSKFNFIILMLSNNIADSAIKTQYYNLNK